MNEKNNETFERSNKNEKKENILLRLGTVTIIIWRMMNKKKIERIMTMTLQHSEDILFINYDYLYDCVLAKYQFISIQL